MFVSNLSNYYRWAQICWFSVMRQGNMVSLLPCCNDSTKNIMKLKKVPVLFPSYPTTDHTMVYLCFLLHSSIGLLCSAQFLILWPIQKLLSHLYLSVQVLRTFHLLTARVQMKLKLQYWLMKFRNTLAGDVGQQQYGERGTIQMIQTKFV